MHRLLCILIGAFLAQCRPTKAPTGAPLPATQAAPSSITKASDAQQIAWLDSERLMPVLEMAQREKKPVFVVFHATWCAPCKVMEEEIFTQPEVYHYLNQHFLNFRTDFDAPAGRTIAEIYEVEKLPTVLFLNPQGLVLERYLGIVNPSQLKTMGTSAWGKMGK